MSKYNEIKAALLGAGTVGGGVYKLIEKRKSEMPSRAYNHQSSGKKSE